MMQESGGEELGPAQPGVALPPADLSDRYRAYIACLNRQEWSRLGHFVDEAVVHNGRALGLAGYQAMLERDFEAIPDLVFDIGMLVVAPPHVAVRLRFDCRPKGMFLGLNVNGRRVCFAENVIYAFRAQRIAEVWSVIDKAAIEALL